MIELLLLITVQLQQHALENGCFIPELQ